jgi:hypothetical protein
MKTKIEMYCLNFIYRTLLPVQDYTSNAHATQSFLANGKKTIDFLNALSHTHIYSWLVCMSQGQITLAPD